MDAFSYGITAHSQLVPVAEDKKQKHSAPDLHFRRFIFNMPFDCEMHLLCKKNHQEPVRKDDAMHFELFFILSCTDIIPTVRFSSINQNEYFSSLGSIPTLISELLFSPARVNGNSPSNESNQFSRGWQKHFDKYLSYENSPSNQSNPHRNLVSGLKKYTIIIRNLCLYQIKKPLLCLHLNLSFFLRITVTTSVFHWSVSNFWGKTS